MLKITKRSGSIRVFIGKGKASATAPLTIQKLLNKLIIS